MRQVNVFCHLKNVKKHIKNKNYILQETIKHIYVKQIIVNTINTIFINKNMMRISLNVKILVQVFGIITLFKKNTIQIKLKYVMIIKQIVLQHNLKVRNIIMYQT